MTLLTALVNLAPFALEAGLKIAPLIQEALNQGTEKDATDDFAAKALESIPQMISAGIAVADIAASLKQTNDDINRMIAENRGPNEAEWAAQDARIKRLEDELDQASRPRP